MSIEKLDWFSEAVRARDAYERGEEYKDFPVPGSTGWCARCARALFQAVTGRRLPFSQRDFDRDGDIDALDMLQAERAAGFVRPSDGAHGLQPGYRLYKDGGPHGHVGVVITMHPPKVLENTTASRKGKGPGTIIVPLSYFGPYQWVGFYRGETLGGTK